MRNVFLRVAFVRNILKSITYKFVFIASEQNSGAHGWLKRKQIREKKTLQKRTTVLNDGLPGYQFCWYERAAEEKVKNLVLF